MVIEDDCEYVCRYIDNEIEWGGEDIWNENDSC